MLSLGEAKNSRLKRIAGTCSNTQDFLDLINDATRMLMTRGSWFSCIQRIEACVYNECVVWPRGVFNVLALNTCGRYTPIWNNWFQFVPIGPAGIKSHGFGWDGGSFCGDIRAGDHGTSPVFNNVPCGKSFYVRAYPSHQADVGKTITIFGIDVNGQVAQTQDASGIWHDGEPLILKAPFVSTSRRYREVIRVLKDKTQSPARLFFYDADNNVLLDCAYYEPSEISPEYRVTKIQGIGSTRSCTNAPCNGAKTIQALVKLSFIPVEFDSDLIQIDNLDALTMAIQSIRQSDSYSAEEAEKQMSRAIHEMNLDLRNRFGVGQTSISIDPGIGAGMCRARIGRMI